MKKKAISVYLFDNTADPSSYRVAMQNREKTLMYFTKNKYKQEELFSTAAKAIQIWIVISK